MATLFLDANILLDFYRFGADDVTEIEKLISLIEDSEIKLLSNEHLRNEILRNRETVISHSFNEFKSIKFDVKAPNFCRGSREFDELNQATKEAGKKHNTLIEYLERKIERRDLPADALIKRLLKNSINIEITDEIIDKAKLRIALKNPPGKSLSLGDAIHWECLLGSQDLYSLALVTKDSDFASSLSRKELNEFLSSEWRQNKLIGKVTLYPSLSDFLKSNYPQIKLSAEEEKRSLISQLEESPNFSATHSIISELSKFEFFTAAQIIRLFIALVENSQIGWIGTDQDVKEFYLRLKDKSFIVPNEYHEKIALILEEDKDIFFSIDF